MKTKNTKWLKRVTAIVLCAVLLLTSIPIAFAANGEYNPAPYFSDEAQQSGAAAWLDEEGVLQVRFPEATGRPKHAVWSVDHNSTNVKAIKSYVIELSDLGGKLEVHDTTPDVLLTKTVSAADLGTGKLSTSFSAAEIEALGDKFDIVNKRYNIAITAVDSEGWHSLQLHAMVFDVPEFYFDMSKFQILSEDAYAMRELMRFEEAGSKTGYVQTGDSVKSALRANSVGAADPTTNVNTYGYRVHISSKPGENGQTIDTTESRQTYNFVGAKEVWYYLDLSDVELQGISFRLRANEKKLRWVSRTALSNTSKAESLGDTYGGTVYSTLGTKYNTYAAGEEPYILIQNENGNWEKVLLNNGTVDLGHFKGYVRIPIQYICAETDSTVDSNSKEFGSKQGNTQSTLNNYFDTKIKLSSPVVVNTKGTPIADSLLIQEGQLWAGRASGDLIYEMGKMLAAGIELGANGATTGVVAVNPNNPRRAYIEQDASGNWIVQNRENGHKAIEDIYSAGIGYTGVSDDSVNQSFFIDNVMFYRTDTNAWEHADLGVGLADGTTVATYFNQYTDAQDKILDAIDKYIGSPTWTDYRGVKYVDDMVKSFYATYKQYKGVQCAEDYFTDTGLSARAAATGRAQTWENYQTAKKLCGDNKLLDGNNSRPNDLVPMLVQSLEQLPDPSQVTNISDALYEEIIKDYQAYTRLNYGQLKMLGNYTDESGKMLYEEEKILKYAQLLADQLANNAVTGYKMANYPFIPFNDFENNVEVGDKAYHLEDDINYILNGINGNTNLLNYSQYKNLTTYATDKFNETGGTSNENSRDIQYVYSNTDVFAHAGESEITSNGYKDSNGYTTTIYSKNLGLNSGKTGGVTYSSRINKDSVNTATNFDQFTANNMSSANLGGLTMSHGDNDDAMKGSTYLPFSLAMYVDFSEMTDESGAGNFNLTFKIHTLDGSKNRKTYFIGLGSYIGSSEWWRSYYFIDQSTGEWVRSSFDANGMTSGVRFFPSKSSKTDSQGNPISLSGYKGYIAIPMVDFKSNGWNENDYLMEKTDELNNIYSVEIVFAPANGEGAKFANKSFTIDNIGFTYDPDFYTSKGKDLSGRNDLTYAEAFNAKSSKATEFEQAVADIDPYDDTTLASKIEAAKNLYGAPYNTDVGTLSQWQKDNVQTVKQAKALLDKYIDHLNGVPNVIPAAVMAVDELKTAIANLPNIPENAVTANLLPNPGFISDSSKPLEAGEVNYKAFGFESKAQAEEIAKYYTDTYRRLSSGDKVSLTDDERTTLINAYNAAMRCTGTLETIREKAIAFSDTLKTVYTRYTDGTQTLNLISVSKRNEVAELSATEYEPLPYYAKLGLGDGSLIPAFKGMTDGISRYFANVITDDAGNITDGGVKVLMDKYTALYAEVKTQLDAKQLLSDDLVSRLNDAIAEYNDLIPAYKNIFELYYGSVQADASGQYQGIKDIVELFERTDVAFESGATTETLTLNKDNIDTESKTLNVNYLEELPVVTGGASNTYFTIKYDGILSAGTVLRDYELTLNGNTVQKVAYNEDGIVITDALLGGTLKNNTYTSANPFAMEFKAKLTSTEPFSAVLSDTVTICHYRPADTEKGETEPYLLGTYTLNVEYIPDEAYTVTIPAEIPVEWGADSKDVSYTVDCVLKDTSAISVKVEGSNVMTAEKDSSYTIDYTPENFDATVFKGVQTGAKPAAAPTVKFADGVWETKPVGKYTDTLTYTVEYTS